MSAFWRCDLCNKVTDPNDLRKLVALFPMTAKLVVAADLHAGELCVVCVEKVRAKLPQPLKKEGEDDAPQVVPLS